MVSPGGGNPESGEGIVVMMLLLVTLPVAFFALLLGLERVERWMGPDGTKPADVPRGARLS